MPSVTIYLSEKTLVEIDRLSDLDSRNRSNFIEKVLSDFIEMKAEKPEAQT